MHDVFNVALKNDGTVAAWGWASDGRTAVPACLTQWGGDPTPASRTCWLLKKAMAPWSHWGWNAMAETSVAVDNVVAVAGGAYYSLALKSDGTVVAWGYQPSIPRPTSTTWLWSPLADGYNLALKSDGTVVAWALQRGGPGQYGRPVLNNVVSQRRPRIGTAWRSRAMARWSPWADNAVWADQWLSWRAWTMW